MKSLINALLTLLTLLLLSATTLALPTANDDTTLVERQNGCLGSVPCVELDGDGFPHQQILHKQLSVWMDCGGTTCGVADWQQKSYTLTADFHGLPFTTGGFDISQSVDTGIREDGCTGGPGQKACVWATIWHTDFTVKVGKKNNCFVGCDAGHDTTIVRAPNTINNGVEYYCAYGSACGDQGQEFWIAGPAMSPPSFAALDKRQSCFPAGSCTTIEGDGDPHQWILHKQISEGVSCQQSVCVTPPQTGDFTISANTHGMDWISGGLDVVESVNTGYHDSCWNEENKSYLTVCVKVAIWHTDYTVRGGIANQCAPDGCLEYDDTTIIRSPNRIAKVSDVEWYCAYDSHCDEKIGGEFWVDAGAGPPPTSEALDKRQGCLPVGSCTSIEGNGDPHQWILHKQLSATLTCSDIVCAIPPEQQTSYTISADTHGLDWISGGLDVAESVDTGVHDGCTAGSGRPGNSVCVKAVIWHTDYTVRGGVFNTCGSRGCIENDDTKIIRSPNEIRTGVEYYCAYDDDCADRGSESWFFAQDGPPPASQALEKRECTTAPCAVANGEPRQMSKQIKDYDAHAVYDDSAEWKDFGYAVSDSINVGIPGESGPWPEDCVAKPGQVVCIYADIWYTVQPELNGEIDSCEPGEPQCKGNGLWDIWSPNDIKDVVNFVCARDYDSGDKGREVWLDAHVAGGPP